MKTVTRVVLLLAVAVLALGGASFAKTSHSSSSSSSSGDAWMGVYTQTVDKELAKAFKLNSERGVVVNEIVSESPADKAGLKEEDVILSANGTTINDPDDLSNVVEKAKPGDKMSLDVVRGGHEMQVVVTLGDRSDNPDRGFSVMQAPKAGRAWAFNFNNDEGSYIGVQLTDLSTQLGDYFGVEDGNGVLITDVEKDTPADKAGLKAGDIIVAIDDEKVSQSGDVQDAVQGKEAGSTVSIGIMRERHPMTLKVEVEKRFDEGGRRYGVRIPKVQIPSMRGLYLGDDNNQYFDSKDFRRQMDELRKELENMKSDLKDNDSVRDQLRQLKDELRALQQKVH